MTHDHHHSTATRSEHVMLELGVGVGALLLYTDPELHGKEIEISPSRAPDACSHKQVHQRLVAGRTVYAAVFDQLEAGQYTLWIEGLERETGVPIEAGSVTELDWRTPATDTTPNQGGTIQ